MRTQNRDCEIKKYVTIKTMGNVEQIGYKARALEQSQTLRKLAFNNFLRVKNYSSFNIYKWQRYWPVHGIDR